MFLVSAIKGTAKGNLARRTAEVDKKCNQEINLCCFKLLRFAGCVLWHLNLADPAGYSTFAILWCFFFLWTYIINISRFREENKEHNRTLFSPLSSGDRMRTRRVWVLSQHLDWNFSLSKHKFPLHNLSQYLLHLIPENQSPLLKLLEKKIHESLQICFPYNCDVKMKYP